MPDIRTAAEDGDLEKVKEFLQAGDDVNRVDRYGNTPLMLVLSGWGSRVSGGTNSNNDIALVKLLIDHGADVTLANKCGDTPLHLAASTIPLIKSKFPTFMKVEDIKTANFAKDNIPVIHLLLSNGAKVNARNNVGETPLDSALKFNWDNPNKKMHFLK